MDRRTLEYYSKHIKDVAEFYNSAGKSGVSRYFRSAFKQNSSVIDLGAGSGRDMSILQQMGYDVYGVDASIEMVEYIIRYLPSLRERVICAEVPSDEQFFGMKFDGVLCSAMLMHVTDDLIAETSHFIRGLLKDDGRLLVSVPVERDDVDSDGRTPEGRLFVMRTPEYYHRLFQNAGFRKTGYYEEGDSLGRKGMKWGVALYDVV